MQRQNAFKMLTLCLRAICFAIIYVLISSSSSSSSRNFRSTSTEKIRSSLEKSLFVVLSQENKYHADAARKLRDSLRKQGLLDLQFYHSNNLRDLWSCVLSVILSVIPSVIPSVLRPAGGLSFCCVEDLVSIFCIFTQICSKIQILPFSRSQSLIADFASGGLACWKYRRRSRFRSADSRNWR